MEEEPSLFHDGNGSLRVLRLITIVGGAAAAVIAIFGIMWWVFSLVSGALSQPSKNEALERRISIVEASQQAMQVQMSAHEMRITSLRSDFESTRSADARFQDDIRSSIAKVTEIVTAVRLSLAERGTGPHR